MPKEHLEPLFDDTWLNTINRKRKLIDAAYGLKAKISHEIWKDALRVYEAQDKYLNQLTIEELGNFVKDLQAANNR